MSGWDGSKLVWFNKHFNAHVLEGLKLKQYPQAHIHKSRHLLAPMLCIVQHNLTLFDSKRRRWGGLRVLNEVLNLCWPIREPMSLPDNILIISYLIFLWLTRWGRIYGKYPRNERHCVVVSFFFFVHIF